jgi:hypothetical protein
MEIQVKETNTIYYAKTTDYILEIDGQEHTFRFYDSTDEEQYWFDGEEYYREDEIMEGLTIEDIFNNL